MKQLADGVWQLKGFPRDNINIYVIGDVLIDAGTVFHKRGILRQLRGREIAAHAITHAHIDHVGASHAVCEALDIPLWAGKLDVESVETGKMDFGGGRKLPQAPRHHVDRALVEDDEVGGFAVLDTPGHSPGHVSYWRESDGVLLCGDVMWGYNPFRLGGPIREPFTAFSPDPRLNRESARRLAALEPKLICFGHGPALTDTARFVAAAERLPT